MQDAVRNFLAKLANTTPDKIVDEMFAERLFTACGGDVTDDGLRRALARLQSGNGTVAPDNDPKRQYATRLAAFAKMMGITVDSVKPQDRIRLERDALAAAIEAGHKPQEKAPNRDPALEVTREELSKRWPNINFVAMSAIERIRWNRKLVAENSSQQADSLATKALKAEPAENLTPVERIRVARASGEKV